MGKKTFFVVVVALGALYLASLGVGVVTQPDEPKSRQEAQQQQAARQDAARGSAGNPLLGAIDWLLSPFAPGLLLRDARCNGQPVDKAFQLTAGKGCLVALPNPDKDYRRGTLVVRTDGVDMLIFAPEGDVRLNAPLACPPTVRAGRTTLCVAYTQGTPPSGTTPSAPRGPWLKRSAGDGYTVSVQPTAGTLFLACAGCEAPGRTLSLRLD